MRQLWYHRRDPIPGVSIPQATPGSVSISWLILSMDEPHLQASLTFLTHKMKLAFTHRIVEGIASIINMKMLKKKKKKNSSVLNSLVDSASQVFRVHPVTFLLL